MFAFVMFLVGAWAGYLIGTIVSSWGVASRAEELHLAQCERGGRLVGRDD